MTCPSPTTLTFSCFPRVPRLLNFRPCKPSLPMSAPSTSAWRSCRGFGLRGWRRWAVHWTNLRASLMKWTRALSKAAPGNSFRSRIHPGNDALRHQGHVRWMENACRPCQGSFFIKPAMLLLDEPTAHLDLEACVWLEDYLSKYNRILIIVSHSQDFNGVCTNIMHLFQTKPHQLHR